jgi:hypothetical protein
VNYLLYVKSKFLTLGKDFLLEPYSYNHFFGGLMKKEVAILFVALVLFVSFLASCSNSNPSSTQPATVLDGKTLVETRCTVCHTTDRIIIKKATLEQWQTTVDRMIGKGAKLTAEEEKVLVQYLADTYK